MKRSPAAAFWLSLLPGLGHLYLGQVAKGFALALLAAGLINVLGHAGDSLGMLVPVYWLFVMLDAQRTAQELNRAAEKGVSSVGRNGSPWWGATLIGLGVLFLLLNFDVIDFDRIWRFWPVVLIVLGGKFLRQGWGGKAAGPPPVPPTSEAFSSPSEEGTDDRAR